MNINMCTLDRKLKFRVSRNAMRNIQKRGYARLFFAALNIHTKQLSGVCRITFAASTLGGRLLWKICLAKCPHIINPRLVWTKYCAEYLRLCFNGFADSILRMVVYNCKYFSRCILFSLGWIYNDFRLEPALYFTIIQQITSNIAGDTTPV